MTPGNVPPEPEWFTKPRGELMKSLAAAATGRRGDQTCKTCYLAATRDFFHTDLTLPSHYTQPVFFFL